MCGHNLQKLFFLTGAPRSGTTFLSDWITTAPNAYCVHEVLPELRQCHPEHRVALLQEFSRTSADRLGKPLQREFLNWEHVCAKQNPEVLGLKNPWIWNEPTPEASITETSPSLLARVIVLMRHPFDMVASGFERGLKTRNWPNYTAAMHVGFFRAVTEFVQGWRNSGKALLLIRYEDLLLRPEQIRTSIEEFLGVTLNSFSGNEHEAGYFDRLSSSATIRLGTPENSKRALLSAADRDVIRRTIDECSFDTGYDLA